MARVCLLTQGAALGYVLLPLRGVLLASFDTPKKTNGSTTTFTSKHKKNPNRGSPLLGFPFYICFSDIYLTSTFLDVPSLILTTLMPF